MNRALNNPSQTMGEMPWVTQKVNEIKQHPAWNENIKTEMQSESILMGEPVFTFLFRPGRDPNDILSYFLSFVGMDGVIYHKPLQILLSPRGWLYRNGSTIIRESVHDLVPAVLHCTYEQCRPYNAPRAPLFSLN